MLKYANLILAFAETPLAMLPEKIAAVRRVLLLRARGERVPEEEVRAAVAGKRPRAVEMYGRTAVIPVFGMIAQRVSMMEDASGGTGADQIGADIDAAVNDPGCRNLCLVFDSPGGSVYGVAELAARIRAAGERKKVVAAVDSVAASAAYWLAAQCAEINVTPGGTVGSIGVYQAHVDESAAEQMEGCKTTLVSAGKYKTEGNPFGPLDDAAREEMQRKVDAYYAAFVADVARGRGVTEARVRADYGQGRMVLAADAVKCGMADRVADLATVLKRMGADDARRAATAQAAAVARLAEVESEQ